MIPPLILEYLRRDWYVFPLHPGQKTPATRRGWKDATLDAEQVAAWCARWPHANWGIATGPSELLVVDLDGADGERAWLELTNGRHVQTITSLTGSGGWHIIYRDPTRTGRNSTRLLGPGIDTRGQGGYIVAPPSIHPNGKPYQWMTEGRHVLAQPDTAPAWLLGLLRRSDEREIRRSAPRMAFSRDGSTPLGVSVMQGILRRLTAAQDGNRHDLNYWAGVRVGQLHAAGHVGPDALGTILDAALAVRKDGDATRRDTLDGWRWGLEHPGNYPAADAAREAPRRQAPRLRPARLTHEKETA